MNFDKINSQEEQAIDIVVNVINKAKSKMGIRQNLYALASGRANFENSVKVPLHDIVVPFGPNCEKLIVQAIENVWRLSDFFEYVLRFMGSSQTETSNYYYYEAVFSQATIKYPVPQAAASVFFKVEDKLLYPPERVEVPSMFFRLEGQTTDHDVRYILLTVDWILATIQMKSRFFKRVEALGIF